MVRLNHTHLEILKFLSRNINSTLGKLAANVKHASYGSLKNHISLLEDHGLVFKTFNNYVTVSLTEKGYSYLRARDVAGNYC